MYGVVMRQKLFGHIKKKYKVKQEYPWRKYPDYAVLRHSDNNKWFALVAEVERTRLGLPGDEYVPIVNLKVDDLMFRDMLIQEEGIMPAYHMNKQYWITVLLDGSVSKEWIIPANPKYYDIVHAFDDTDEIDWKQGVGIKTGDTVFMYVASPVSAIIYKCKVTETDIPYKYADENLTITALMKIKLLKRYKSDRFTFDVLKEEYGIYAIRGPRGIPNSLSAALK